MSLPHQKFREAVFQILYSLDIGQPDEQELISLIMKELNITKKSTKEALARAQAIQSKQDDIDSLIKKVTKSYAFERIQTIERNVLRLGIFELFYDEVIPPKVAIAEAMRLSRKFSTPESSAFINALLDTLYGWKSGKEINTTEIDKTLTSLEKREIAEREVAEEIDSSEDGSDNESI